MAVIRELTVLLGFEVDSKKVAAAERAYANLKTAALGVVGAVTAATGAVIAATFETAAYGDELAKTSQRIGIGVEALQGLEFAAKLSGSSVEGMRAGLQALSRQAGNAGRGVKGSAKLFQELGIQVKTSNGQIRPTEDLLGDVADKLSGMSDESRRVAFAQKLLGASGVELLPTLLNGRDGLAAMRKEAEELGLVMSTQATQAASEFSDEYDKAKLSIMGVVREVAGEFLPAMTGLIREFRDWFAVNRALIRQNIHVVFRLVTQGLTLAGRAASALFDVVKNLVNAMGGLRNVLGVVSTAIGVMMLANLAKLIISLGGAAVGFRALAAGALRMILLPGLAAAKWFALGFIVFAVVQDIIRFASGAESALGRLITFMTAPQFEGEHWIVTTMKDITRAIGETADALATFFGVAGRTLAFAFGADTRSLDEIKAFFADEAKRFKAGTGSIGGANDPFRLNAPLENPIVSASPSFRSTRFTPNQPPIQVSGVTVNVDATKTAGTPEELGAHVASGTQAGIESAVDNLLRKAQIGGLGGATVR